MTNALQTVQDTTRAALLQRDAATARTLLRGYAVTRQRLQVAQDALLRAIAQRQAEGLPIGAAWLRKQERFTTLLQQIDTEINRFAQQANATVTAAQQQAVLLASNHADELMRSVGVDTTFNRLPRAALEELTGTLADGQPISTLFDTFGPTASQAGRDALFAGIAQGKGVKVIAAELQRVFNTSAVRAMTIARTETMRSYRSASLETYKANDDVLAGWVWSAAISDRTCPFCLSKNGTFHELKEAFDTHPNCRCSPLPSVRKD